MYAYSIGYIERNPPYLYLCRGRLVSNMIFLLWIIGLSLNALSPIDLIHCYVPSKWQSAPCTESCNGFIETVILLLSYKIIGGKIISVELERCFKV